MYYIYWIWGLWAGYRLLLKGRAGDMTRIDAIKNNSAFCFRGYKRRHCAWMDGFHKTNPNGVTKEGRKVKSDDT